MCSFLFFFFFLVFVLQTNTNCNLCMIIFSVCILASPMKIIAWFFTILKWFRSFCFALASVTYKLQEWAYDEIATDNDWRSIIIKLSKHAKLTMHSQELKTLAICYRNQANSTECHKFRLMYIFLFAARSFANQKWLDG